MLLDTHLEQISRWYNSTNVSRNGHEVGKSLSTELQNDQLPVSCCSFKAKWWNNGFLTDYCVVNMFFKCFFAQVLESCVWPNLAALPCVPHALGSHIVLILMDVEHLLVSQTNESQTFHCCCVPRENRLRIPTEEWGFPASLRGDLLANWI